MSNFLKIIFYLISLLFAAISVGLTIFFYYGQTLPSERTLLSYSPPMTTKIYSHDDELIEEYAVEKREIIRFNKIPLIVKGAFLIAEDRGFYEHFGISLQSLFRAVVENTSKKSWDKKPAGGSTITQQIAKNLLVGNERSLSRKIREAIMAFRIESSVCKDKIFEIYLNQLYLGRGLYGVVEACNCYFNKSIDKIKPHEAAFLAAIPSAPSVYINSKNMSKVLSKRNSILYQMYELGYISNDDLKISIAKPIDIKSKKRKLSAPYFSDEVFRQLSQIISADSFLKHGYQIRTTMHRNVQYAATMALENGLIDYTKAKEYNGPLRNIKNDLGSSSRILKGISSQLPSTLNKIIPVVVVETQSDRLVCKDQFNEIIKVRISDKFYTRAKLRHGDVILCREIKDGKYELYQDPRVTGCIAVMDLDSGDILGMSGGYSFDISSFNCMTQARRQPGSTIKPFVYSVAIESGMSEDDVIDDVPVSIALSDGTRYSPSNYDKKYSGEVTLRAALMHSKNLATINLALQIGMKPISDLLRKAELIRNKIPISAVLGAIETTPMKLMSAFSAFFNKGFMLYPRFIESIERPSNGSNLNDEPLCQKRRKFIFTEKTAETIQKILHDTVEFGTAKRLFDLEEKYKIKLFGKTGTTNQFKDAWFVGAIINDDFRYLVCVFVGYHDAKTLGDRMSGAKVALPIFKNFVEIYSTYLK
jgi:penicillin-binding protein 1A